ncbi:hypothetical protein [Streptomyces sp. NPDC088557]|uniref:hypothetical protein n=1 Tax=Streptomyces sp. NPDC088557 TaxID=3365867 RepID=UPI0038164E1B
MSIGAGAMRATREVVKRLIRERLEEAVGYVVAFKPHPLGHGEHKPPCRSCSIAMEMAGTTAYAG